MSRDKYGSGQDADCYPGSDVLINLLDLRDPDDLEDAERYLSAVAASTLEFIPPPYNWTPSSKSIASSSLKSIAGPVKSGSMQSVKAKPGSVTPSAWRQKLQGNSQRWMQLGGLKGTAEPIWLLQ